MPAACFLLLVAEFSLFGVYTPSATFTLFLSGRGLRMPLPARRVVTGKYVNPVTGEPYDGTKGEHYVIFEPVPDRWADLNGHQILLGGGRIDLDTDGTFSQEVVCTDASGVLPAKGRLWRLRQFVGGVWASQVLVVPEGDGSPLDITAFSKDVCGATYAPVAAPLGPQGESGPPGGAGPAGKSAHQEVTEDGFTGTE